MRSMARLAGAAPRSNSARAYGCVLPCSVIIFDSLTAWVIRRAWLDWPMLRWAIRNNENSTSADKTMAIGLERMSLPKLPIGFIVNGPKIFAMDSTLGAETNISKKIQARPETPRPKFEH